MESGSRRAWIPASVAVELVILREHGRSHIGLPELAATMDRNPEVQLLPLDFDQIQQFTAVRAIRDPFNRLPVAAALAVDCPLVSRDEALKATGAVQIVWD